ncbi:MULTISPECIES: hypothetical protein [unclassified Nitratiruptor]|uniref:hypothetical protein n=1 Tax=unclassified Nitratiruptor TaxID=2624044 RepID=UPI0019169B24|nr:MULTISPECIES: hypothetical protein [unclassified Nitratiruptor]BCD59878.1 hypothetical protein NitYY0810_C0637 [Nitratiruptor sp. YY08-10]BCD63801.1 hypothetical protein NitYY0814_C0636 [Nitratiruptor sp. YY08-14]
MDFNLDDLRKEFDALKAAKDFKDEEACEIGCEPAEEAEGFIETIQKYMLAPANCGVYYSRLDIKIIGLMIEEDVQVRERKRMIRDILRSITSKEALANLFEVIEKVGQEKIDIYDQLSQAFPHSGPIFDDKKAKFQEFKKVLAKILEDFEEVEEEI